ncbi:DUF6702 family protein [Mucilaginibacter flavus]|uniref:DUF6702 family protein n=1 Tax=Mucilaginibacter flavus TaxID=931504 RepID=UPI0025B617D6|nr:DUF6702 family protein [Mucilaginibacter flavus]MDN3584074.1 hypothetical protein [Mucilaginibacter flavus]
MLQLLLISWFSIFHPFYVSVTEITHNAKTQSLEVSSRIFYDDLERTLEKQYHTPVDIVHPKDKTKLNQMVSDYIKKHLVIKADGKLLSLSYVGYEVQEDAAWAYFEVKGISKVKKVEVHNDILFDEHKEQINMLHVTVAGERKSTKLDNPDADAGFEF